MPVLGNEESTRIRFTTLSKSTPGGLKSNLVRDVTQDMGGYVWLATDQGVTRFDGWESVHFQDEFEAGSGLGSNQVAAIATPPETSGPLWIGTSSDGLVRLDHRTGEVIKITTESTFGAPLLSNTIVGLAISVDDRLWIGTDRGLNIFDLETQEMTVAKGAPGSARIASVNWLGEKGGWIGTHDGGLYKWDPETDEFAEIWKTNVPVTAAVVDAAGKIWIGTKGHGLYAYSPDRSPAPEKVELDAVDISALLVDSSANLWVGTRKGLAFFDRANDSFLWFRSDPRRIDSLADNQVNSLFEDRSRMLWVATLGGGTSRFSLERRWFPHIRGRSEKGPGLPDASVRSLSRGPDGHLWLGTERGLARWDPETASFSAAPEIGALKDTAVVDTHWDREGSLWLATTGGGLVRRDSDGEETVFRQGSEPPLSIGHDNVSAVHGDDANRLHVGTQGAGLWSLDRETGRFSRVASTSDADAEFIGDIDHDEDGNLWVAGNNTLLVLQAGDDKLRPFREAFPNADPLSSPLVTTILADSNGIVWIGTSNAGLDRLNTGTGEISNFNRAIDGLPDDKITGLVKDGDGLLWVGTRTGIARLNAMQNKFRVFSGDDGLQAAGFNLGALTRTDEGILYFGGRDGFNIVDPGNLPELPQTPSPILTGFEYFGETVVPREGGILEKQIAATSEIVIPFDRRTRFAIRFGNLDYRFPNRGHFRYMLKGHEYDWQDAGPGRKASYSGLPAGKYTFMVQSSLNGRDWTDIAAQVDIRVTPPWWATWWFRLLGALLVVFGTVALTKFLIQSRIKQLRRREQQITAQRDKAEAVLARQLQSRMLLERTTRELNNDLREGQILNDALQTINEQFGTTHCLIHRLVDEPDEEGGTKRLLKQIGYCTATPGGPDSAQPRLTIDVPLVAQVIESPSPISVTDTESLPEAIRAPFGESTAISLISSRASFLDEPNGMVTLLRVDRERPWSGEEIKLLEALTGQFGIVIAQINTAATEEKYRQHLEKTSHDAEVANRAKSDFLAKMTHELRTPLNAIIGFSDILSEDDSLNPRQRETLDIINNSGEHLLDVINEILDLSKIEAGKIEKNEEAFELVGMLRSVYEMLALKAREKRIGFHFSTRTALPREVVTDRSKLRQILINLLGNAIKFTAQGAVGLSVKAVALDESESMEGRLERKVRLEFEIRDTGRGISEEEVPKLFERYSQSESGRRSTEGTGLGLPIARSFVQLLGGDVAVESIVGEGTTFSFNIECREVAATVANPLEISSALDEHSAQRIVGFTSPLEEVRILIAEDQPTNRLLLKKILGKAGFKLEEARDGQEAIEKWNDWKPHLIFMDEDMPIKKGSEATREIRALVAAEDGPIIVSLTAYALEQARTSALEAGCADFVAKPFRSHELFSVISKHLAVEYVFNDAA